MPLRNSITIAADADRVWPFIADPRLQARWNPNIVSLERQQSGAAHVGEQFTMICRLAGRESQSRVEVIASEAPRRMVFRHRTMWKNSEQIVDETYAIFSHPAGVRIVQTIDLSRAGIPWPFRILIAFINRFGWDAQEPCLSRLKQLAEQPQSAAPSTSKARPGR